MSSPVSTGELSNVGESEDGSPGLLSPAQTEVTNGDAESVSPRSSVGSEQSLTTQVRDCDLDCRSHTCKKGHQARPECDYSCSLDIDPISLLRRPCQQIALVQVSQLALCMDTHRVQNPVKSPSLAVHQTFLTAPLVQPTQHLLSCLPARCSTLQVTRTMIPQCQT